MDYSILNKPEYADKLVYAKKFSPGYGASIRTAPVVASQSLLYAVGSEKLIGTATGKVALYSDNTLWIQVKPENPSYSYLKLWVLFKNTAANPGTTEATSDVQALLDKIIKNDIILYHRMLLLYNGVMDMKKKGKDISAFKAKGLALMTSYNERQQWIADNSGKVKKGYLPGFKNTVTKYNSKFDLKGIGELTIGAIALIVCIVLAIAGTAVTIYLLQPKYDESKANLKVCKELEDLLKTTDPETATKIKEDLEEQIDDAYNKGQKAQWWKGTGGLVKTGLIVAASAFVFFWGVPKLMETGKKNYKKASA